MEVEGIAVRVETPAEILAKKIQYRGIAFAERDIFDLAVVMQEDEAEVEAAVRACTADAVAATAQAIARSLPGLPKDLSEHVNPTPSFRSLLGAASRIVRQFPGVAASLRSGKRG